MNLRMIHSLCILFLFLSSFCERLVTSFLVNFLISSPSKYTRSFLNILTFLGGVMYITCFVCNRRKQMSGKSFVEQGQDICYQIQLDFSQGTQEAKRMVKTSAFLSRARARQLFVWVITFSANFGTPYFYNITIKTVMWNGVYPCVTRTHTY